MKRVVLKDKTEFQNATIGKLENFIEIVISKEEAVANIAKFMNPEIMDEIEYYAGAWKILYKGYSRMSHMDNPKENEMHVWMEATEGASISDPIPLFDPMYMPKGV